LRGSGRFEREATTDEVVRFQFQSPSLRGSGRFAQMSSGWAKLIRFQSPSLRGSGRFSLVPLVERRKKCCFNPLHCGAVVASQLQEMQLKTSSNVSIPFIAGQWSLQK